MSYAFMNVCMPVRLYLCMSVCLSVYMSVSKLLLRLNLFVYTRSVVPVDPFSFKMIRLGMGSQNMIKGFFTIHSGNNFI